MDKIGEWLTSKFQQPLSLLFFIGGILLILLGVSTGLQITGLNQLAPDADFRWVSLLIGLAFCVVAIVLFYRSPARAKEGIVKPDQPMPQEFQMSLLQRRLQLSATQTEILDFIEANDEMKHHEYVSQEEIEDWFPKIGRPELFYRLECLRLFGFIEKLKGGHTQEGHDRYLYRLTDEHIRTLGYASSQARSPRSANWRESDK